MKKHENFKKHGFTLVELLITIAVFSIFLTTISLIFQGGITTYKKSEIQINLKENAQSVLDRFAGDARQAYRVTNNGGTWRFEISKYNSNSQQFNTYTVDYRFDQNRRAVLRTRQGESEEVIGTDISSFNVSFPQPDTIELNIEGAKSYQSHDISIRTSTLIEKRGKEAQATGERAIEPTSPLPQELLIDRAIY